MVKRIFTVLSLLLGLSPAFAQHNVTFRVDMGPATVNQTLYLVGSFQTPNAWNLGAIALTNTSGTIYSVTVPVNTSAPGDIIQYKFVNGADWNQQENMTGPCAWPGSNNRYFAFPHADTTLGLTCFQSCGSCVSHSVTFRVDMSGVSVAAGGVHLIGAFQGWDPAATPMTDMGNGIYDVTKTFLPNQYIEYKIINGDNWTTGVQEVVVGGCSIGTNRFLSVPAQDTMVIFKWGYCDPSGTITGLRTACIGNSITYGAGTNNPATESYPAVLRSLLGSGFTVDNFGHSGATLCKHGDNPYWKVAEMNNLMALAPQVAILKLGSNDSKPYNWDVTSGEFSANYGSMIDTLRMARPDVEIFACLTAKAYTAAFEIGETNMVNAIRPQILEVARQKGVSVIDLFDTTNTAAVNAAYANYFPDGVHPNPAGVALLANKVARIVSYLKKPVTQDGQVLSAPAAFGYQWYLNGAIIGATSQQFTITDPGTYTCATKLFETRNDWVMTVPFLITSNEKPVKSSIVSQVYPNPATDEISIPGLDLLQKDKLKIFDSLGRSRSFSWTTNQQMNIGGLAPGVYWVRVGQSKPVVFVKK